MDREEGNKKVSLRTTGAFLLIFILLSSLKLSARVYTIGDKPQWERWKYPKGTIEISDQGEVKPVYFHKQINAVANAHRFKHLNAKGKEVVGGIKDAGSNPKDAPNILDGNPDTWWKPDPEDDLQDWWVDIDLGRVVAATKVRLIFPDTTGAKPFEQFTVYASPGISTVSGKDIFDYIIVGRTTEPNKSEVVEYDLCYTRHGEADTTKYGEYWEETADFLPTQYVGIVLDAKNKDAALAEVEVITVGENLALRTVERGGSWMPGSGKPNNALFDGDMETMWPLPMCSDTEWESRKAYFEWDLGALFWLDEIHLLGYNPGWGGFGLRRPDRWIEGYIIMISDGARTPGGKLDYEPLIDVYNREIPQRRFFKHTFPRRKVRYLFLRTAHGLSSWRTESADIFEIQLYGQGYPARVTMESDLIDLGALIGDKRSKNITQISWVAKAPPGTKIELRTCSGDSLVEEIHYYDKAGNEIPKHKWERLKRINMQGEKKIIHRPGTDWSTWSRLYRNPGGERFLSPSPKRYVKFQVRLLSDDPEIAPSLSSISIHYSNPLVKRVTGQIAPQAVRVDQDTVFTYLITPTWVPGNSGFDRILVAGALGVEGKTVSVESNGQQIVPRSITVTGDSIFVLLPSIVRQQEIAINFRARIIRNSTLFEAFVNHSRWPEVWQRVDPVERGATTVSIPSLPATERLIDHLSISPGIITPNGDGISDQAVIKFIVLKVEKTPMVRIYNLAGDKICEFAARKSISEGKPSWRAIWRGEDSSGEKVAPGIYICQVSVEAESGKTVSNQTIRVAY